MPPISPPPVTGYAPDYLPAYLSNGMMGLRVPANPLRGGIAILNGTNGIHPAEQVASSPYAPYPLTGDINVGTVWLSHAMECVHPQEQRYDFSCGELTSHFTYSMAGVTVLAETVTFCSRTMPTLALQEMHVTVDADCRLTLQAGIEPDGIPGRYQRRLTRTPNTDHDVVDGALEWEFLGGLSTCGIAYCTTFLGTDAVERSVDEWKRDSPLATRYQFDAHPGQHYTLRQITSMVPSELHHTPIEHAMRLAFMGQERGFDRVRTDNHAAWDDLWRGRIHLVGAGERWQALADAAYFYLHTSAHPSSPSSTSPYGLAQWDNYDYYLGHVMWDLEVFGLPALMLSAPETARAMLAFRAKHLDAARANAALCGYRGLQFPWQVNALTGEEATPTRAAPSMFEQHVTLDVAWAFAQFTHATGDEIYERETTWPVLQGGAEWVMSRVTRTPRGYEILAIIGPAEREHPIDNDGYVNLAAKYILTEAAQCARRLGMTPPAQWEHIAASIFIPTDPATGAITNYDGYNLAARTDDCPEVLGALFPLGCPLDAATERATLTYNLAYGERFVGQPMFSPLLGVYAAWLGDRRRALDLFEEGYTTFAQDRFGVIEEFGHQMPGTPYASPFYTHLGGFLTGMLYGLTGLRLNAGEPTSWCERRVVLPKGWQEIRVDRIWVRGQPMQLSAKHGAAHALLIPLDEAD